MRKPLLLPALWLATTAFSFCGLAGLATSASAHTGGALDADGCHADHRKGTYHCHRGDAAGYTFPNRTAMQEAVRTGNFPEKSVDEEGFFEKLWPWGSKHEQQQATPAPETTGGSPAKAAPAAPASSGSDAAASPPPSSSAGTSAPAAPAPSPSATAPAASATAPAPSAPAAPDEAYSAPAAAAPQNEYERRLKVLQGLYEMGLISREEYEAKRKEVLGQL